MKNIAAEEARMRDCPIKKNKLCNTSRCMGWEVIDEEDEIGTCLMIGEKVFYCKPFMLYEEEEQRHCNAGHPVV